MSKSNLRKHSSIQVDGPDRAAASAMLRASGLEDEDFKKPFVAIAPETRKTAIG